MIHLIAIKGVSAKIFMREQTSAYPGSKRPKAPYHCSRQITKDRPSGKLPETFQNLFQDSENSQILNPISHKSKALRQAIKPGSKLQSSLSVTPIYESGRS
ncbi:MAG: hypothetical protein NT172_18800 [Planctomycetota bacterium]|nr:hypothetical protein [Planctomycetota bacterium]